MPAEDSIRMNGEVVEVLPNATFKVTMPNGHEVLAHLSGRLKKNRIRVILGDMVDLEVSPYDLNRGRIVYRQK